MAEKKKKVCLMGMLLMLIGLLGMIAFILVYLLKMDIGFLSFMFKQGGINSEGVATIVPNTLICFIFGGASILVFLIGLMRKTKKVKK